MTQQDLGSDGRATATAGRHSVLLALSVVLVAINLRPAVAGVGPVLPELRAGLPLSGAGAAVLTTLPVVCFGLLATVRLTHQGKVGPLVAGGAIAIGNVLLPPLIKRDFPDRSGLMMGVYTMAVSGSAAVAAGLAVPLAGATDLGWRGALGAWAVPAAIAALAWVPRASAVPRQKCRPPAPNA